MATIQGVYVALFGRPADPTGLAYFNSVTKNGADLNGIGDLASTQEFKDRFAGQSNVAIINSIYQSLFNRDAETAGLNFFVDALNKGTLNIKNIAIAILDGAQGTDKTIVTNKITAADNFTKALDTPVEIGAYTGNNAAAAGRAFLAPVNATSSSIPTAAATDAAVANIASVSTGGVTLSDATAVTISATISPTATDAKLKTTAGDDTIVLATLNTDTTAAAFTGTIDGGFGSNDTVKLTAVGGANNATGTSVGVVGTPAAPTWTNVEKVTISATGGAGGATAAGGDASVFLSLANATAVKTIAVEAATGATNTNVGGVAAAVAVTNAAVGSNLSVTGAATATSFGFRDAGGSTDTAALALTKAAVGTVTVNGIETLNVTLGQNSQVSTLAGDSLKDLKFSGDGGLVAVGGGTSVFSSTTLKTADFSAVTGSGVNVSVAAATTGVTVTGTKFADTITLNAGATTDKDVVVFNSSNISTVNTIDTITNFTTGEDKIDLKAFGITAGTSSITAFSAAPTNGASFLGNAAGYVGGTLYVDTNKDGVFTDTVDFAVKVAAVAATDIIWA